MSALTLLRDRALELIDEVTAEMHAHPRVQADLDRLRLSLVVNPQITMEEISKHIDLLERMLDRIRRGEIEGAGPARAGEGSTPARVTPVTPFPSKRKRQADRTQEIDPAEMERLKQMKPTVDPKKK